MKAFVFFVAMFITSPLLYGQAVISGGLCIGDTLTAQSSAQPYQIIWEVNGVPVSNSLPQFNSFNPTVIDTAISTSGMCFDDSDNLYIACAPDHCIYKLINNGTSRIVVAGGNGPGASSNQLNGPADVFVDHSGNMFIADYNNNRIQEWLPGADSGITVAGGYGMGFQANQFNGPNGVFVDSSGSVYIADRGNDRIQKWLPGTVSGSTVAGGDTILSPVTNNLGHPVYVALNTYGDMFISDVGNFRVLKWVQGADSGSIVYGGNESWDGTGTYSQVNAVLRPAAITVDRFNNWYTVEWANDIDEGSSAIVMNGTLIYSQYCECAFDRTIAVNSQGCIYVNYLNWDTGQYQQLVKICPTIDYTYVPTTAGSYTATVITYAGDTLVSNPITIMPNANTSISIAASTDTICAGTPVTFTVTNAAGGSAPAYQWLVNGADQSNNGTTYTTPTLADHDTVTAIITSNAVCPSPPTATAQVVAHVNPAVPPTVALSATADTVCAGTPVTYTATATNAGYAITAWLINGTAVGSDSTYTYAPTQGDTVRYTLTNACYTETDSLLPQVIPPTLPDATVVASPGTTVTQGAAVTFTATVTNLTGLSYQWQVNGANVPGATNSTYITATLNNNDQVTCIVSSNQYCTDTAHTAPITIHITEGVAAITGSITFGIYPNPSTGTLTVSTTEGGTLAISTVTGSEVASYKLSKGTSSVILPAHLPAGIYLCTYTTPTEVVNARLVYEP